MSPAHCSQDEIFDHNQDHRKNYSEPAHRFDSPLSTALDIALCVRALKNLQQGAELIQQYCDRMVGIAVDEAVARSEDEKARAAVNRAALALEAPLSRREPV